MKPWLLLIGLTAALPALSQHHPTHVAPAHAHAGKPGYAGLQDRAIKALSETEVTDLRAGKGMSLALPAELNGYPGPSHVLELAEPLSLSREQQQQTQQLFEQMQTDARRLGENVIASEHELDRLFKNRQATVATVNMATAKTASARGDLRAAHLRYHLAMIDVLTPAQVAKYNKLRGYE